MPPTVYPFNRTRTVVMFLGSLAFVAAGVWMIAEDRKWFIGLAAIGFFGLGVFLFGKQLLKPLSPLTLTDKGFKLLNNPEVTWAEVAAVQLRTIKANNTSNTVIEVLLRDEASYVLRLNPMLQRVAKANKMAGFSPVCIPSMGRKHPLPTVVEAMKTHHPTLVVIS